jgi:hypothetical protein
MSKGVSDDEENANEESAIPAPVEEAVPEPVKKEKVVRTVTPAYRG